MNTNRILGIFIGVTLLTWLLIFGLSPQPKYKKNNSINIPKLPESLINLGDSKKIEFKDYFITTYLTFKFGHLTLI